VLTLATLPQTIAQLDALFGFGPRPIRVDYLVLLWAFVPWLWRREEPFDWVRPAFWRDRLGAWRAEVAGHRTGWRSGPEGARLARRDAVSAVRSFLGLSA
jgi:hypothetical protein